MGSIIESLTQNQLIQDAAIALAAAAAVFVLLRIIRRTASLFHSRVASRTANDFDDKIINSIERAAKSIVILAGVYVFFHSLNSVIPGGFYVYVDSILYVLAVFVIARMLNSILQLTFAWYARKAGGELQQKLQDDFGPLLHRIIAIIIYTMAVVAMLKHFNQDVSSIIVSLGVGSLAIAFAAKDTLANMISGFLIITDRPFRIGDRIKLENGTVGDVFDIGLRSTRIKTFDNTLIIVPNQQIINEKVTNLSYPDPQIRVVVDVGVAYGSDVGQVKSLLLEVCKSHPEVLDTPEPSAYFMNFGDSALEFKVMCRVEKWEQQFTVAEQLRTEINRLFTEHDIEIPFPQRVIHMPPSEST